MVARLMWKAGVAGLVVALTVAVPAAVPGAAADFGDKPGCGPSGCPGGAFISQLIGWIGQYSLWASFAAAVFGCGFWAWSKGQGGGVGMATGQRWILAGFAGVAGVALAATVASTLWTAAGGN